MALFCSLTILVCDASPLPGKDTCNRSGAFLFEEKGVMLAPSLVSGEGLDQSRTVRVREQIGRRLYPGAIGKGDPFFDLMAGILPERENLENNPFEREFFREVIEATDIALRLHIEKHHKVPPEYRSMMDETFKNLLMLRMFPLERAYFFRSVVKNDDNYLLGFSVPGKAGLAYDLVGRLGRISKLRLAQYIYHECFPEPCDLSGREHRKVYREVQGAIFGLNEVVALGHNLRSFISDRTLGHTDIGFPESNIFGPDPSKEDDPAPKWLFEITRRMTEGEGKVLSIATNGGKELPCLQDAGFKTAHGMALSDRSLKTAIARGIDPQGLYLAEGTGFVDIENIPDGFYDLIWINDLNEMIMIGESGEPYQRKLFENIANFLSDNGMVAFRIAEKDRETVMDPLMLPDATIGRSFAVQSFLNANGLKEIFSRKKKEVINFGTDLETMVEYRYIIARKISLSGGAGNFSPGSSVLTTLMEINFEENYKKMASGAERSLDTFKAFVSGDFGTILDQVRGVFNEFERNEKILKLLGHIRRAHKRYNGLSDVDQEVLMLTMVLVHLKETFPSYEKISSQELSAKFRSFLEKLGINSLITTRVLKTVLKRGNYKDLGIMHLLSDMTEVDENLKDIDYLIALVDILSSPAVGIDMLRYVREIEGLREKGVLYFPDEEDFFRFRMEKLTSDPDASDRILSFFDEGPAKEGFLESWSAEIRIGSPELLREIYRISPEAAAKMMMIAHNEVSRALELMGDPKREAFPAGVIMEFDINIKDLSEEEMFLAAEILSEQISAGKGIPTGVGYGSGKLVLTFLLGRIFPRGRAVDSDLRKDSFDETQKKDGELEPSPIVSENELRLRAEIFKASISEMIGRDPEKYHIFAIDDDIGGVHNTSYIEPFKIALGELSQIVDNSGNAVFPNLIVLRGRGDLSGKFPGRDSHLGAMIRDVLGERTVGSSPERVFILTTQKNIERGIYGDFIDMSWIVGINDSWHVSEDLKHGYLPLMECLSIAVMAYMGADVLSISGFVNEISEHPVGINEIQAMLKQKLFVILPRMREMSIQQIRQTFDSIRRLLISA